MDFAAFFDSLWRDSNWPKPEPFPWQAMLAERAASGDWPELIGLPTASGKTACLDAAIFALAATADRAPGWRMPRRIWFVVDRRIVVDESFDRARKIAAKLASATEGPAKEVADSLRSISGTGRPLAVARLRGGVWRDDGWARLPAQPAIICSTVDQIGSALLFRAYGHRDNTASIWAGLAANDSLILLDEAHCAVPFMQTLRAIANFRGERWCAEPVPTPFRFSLMSATLPADVGERVPFPRPEERDAALDHPLLRQRLAASKLATLEPAKGGDVEFIARAADHALEFATEQGRRRVAVMVNRVAAAEQIAERLSREAGDSADVALLTGRMRPLDRDALVKKWEPLLAADSKEAPGRPVVVVSTQCLEVGADFSFDALVTECASLDALRQRFGRLDRLGTLGESPAVILARERDTKAPQEEEADPIYGAAIYETWKWLIENREPDAAGTVDFGIDAMDALVNSVRKEDAERYAGLLAPTPDAPILLPAHLDLLSQTSPRPVPEPEVTMFLHGKDRGAPEARVLLRADLPDRPDDRQAGSEWIDILSLVPPTSPEMLSVPLHRLRRWFAEPQAEDISGDVEGAREAAPGGPDRQNSRVRRFLLWRGRGRSEVSEDPNRIRPNDVVVLRLSDDGLGGLGQPIAGPSGLGPGRLDLAEPALRQARGRAVLRIQSDVLAPLADRSAVKALLDVAGGEPDRDEIVSALRAVLDEDDARATAADGGAAQALPGWLKETIETLLKIDFRIEEHPAGGAILIGKKRSILAEAEMEDDPLADEDDLTSEAWEDVTLRRHTADVHRVATDFARRCLAPEVAEAFARAALCHDVGKLDRRFQILLWNGDEDSAESRDPRAKSASVPGRRRRLEIADDLRLPRGFRHEFLSFQAAEQLRLVAGGSDLGDLALHLIASHHGYARPFAPVVTDPLLDTGNAGDIPLSCLGGPATLTSAERQALTPPHRLDSGVPDRFWRLTRRYGWWGLACLEAIFRLADWEASRRPGIANEDPPFAPAPPRRSAPPQPSPLALDALDGSNPLAFLAALGALRLLARSLPAHSPRLGWGQRLGAWRPLLWTSPAIEMPVLAEILHANGLRIADMFSPKLLAAAEAASPKNKKGAPRWKDRLKFPVSAYRDFCAEASASPGSTQERFAAAWAAEAATSSEEGADIARRTRFDFTAGNQAFIGMLRELREKCAPNDLLCSLHSGWRYSAGAVSMRWDTQDEKRQYALQAVDPTNNSGNPPVADVGANFLAVEALPLFPMVPGRGARQPGFGQGSDEDRWRWPIWEPALGLDAIRSLLTLVLADPGDWPAPQRRAIGVRVVFQCRVVQPSGRYRCFTPAESV